MLISKKFLVVIVLLAFFGGYTKLSVGDFQSESTLLRREVPTLDLSAPTFKEAMEQATDPLTTPSSENTETPVSKAADTPLVTPSATKKNSKKQEDPDDWLRRMQILGERAKPSAQTLCEEVAIDMQNFVLEISQDGSTPSMDKISDIQLIADYRKIFPFPQGDEKVVVLQCRATIQYSVKVEAETEFYLLVDSDSNTRVRWEPNNSTSRVIP